MTTKLTLNLDTLGHLKASKMPEGLNSSSLVQSIKSDRSANKKAKHPKVSKVVKMLRCAMYHRADSKTGHFKVFKGI